MTILKSCINWSEFKMLHYHYIKLPLLITTIVAMLGVYGCTQTPTKIDPLKAKGEVSYEDLDTYKAALTALKNNNLDKAENLFNEFSNTQPDLAGSWANLGLIYYKKNKLKKSEKFVNKAIKLNPKNPYAQNLLGMLENKNAKFRNAERHYILAIKYKKNYANAHYNIALLYDLYFREIKKAINHYKQYLKLIEKKGLKDKITTNWLEQLQNSLKKG